MKILKLKMQAFGPFLKEQVIDFNKLNEKGMFLINGPTGTGKTSIFDAIIFALYGQGSGKDRKDSKSLRSDFAKDEVETYVELTFEANNGKEYFIRRSPAYEKTNKKGDGKTIVSPKVELRLPDNTILTKIKEVDQKIIDEILFIDIDQFKHIALLAQGEFTELVVADSKSRAEILEHIFGKEIYSQFQTKLVEKSKQVENEKDVIISSVNTLITKVEGGEEIVGYKEALEDPNNIDVFIKNIESLISELSEKAAIKKEESEKAQKEYNDASNKLEILKQNNLAIEKYHKALKTIEALEKDKELIANLEVLLKKKREFGGLKPYCDQINTLNKAIESKEIIAKDSLEKLKNNAEQEKWLKDNLELYQNNKEQLIKYRETLKILNDINQERKQLIQEKNNVDYLDRTFAINYDNYLKEETKFHEIRTRFFASSSYNLAKELEDGKPCPVCGSLEHPNPAVATDPVSEADYKRAEEKIENSKKRIEQERSKLEASRSALKAKEETFINTLKNNGFKDADLNFIYSDAIEKEIKNINEKIGELKNFIESYERKEKETINTKNTQTQRHNQAVTDTEESKKTLVVVNENINNSFANNEFIKNEEDYKNFLTLCSSNPINEREIRLKVEKYKNDYLSAKTIIENTSKEIKESQSIDLSELEEDVKAKKENSRLIANELNLLNNRIKNLTNDVKSIKEKCDECKDTLAKYRSISELARTTNGFNRFKLSFKMYILADYFDKIITQANKRLQIITNGRYHLIRRNDLGKGNAQQGLDLDVYDIETGKNRAASTLSGGEKFVTALSMALGLSDIIEEEHALVQVESIFIDEGFGSLDSDYLDMAMKALETIRLDNKTIAIISHVEKLKEYVSDGLLVKKANTGSEIEMVENY